MKVDTAVLDLEFTCPIAFPVNGPALARTLTGGRGVVPTGNRKGCNSMVQIAYNRTNGQTRLEGITTWLVAVDFVGDDGMLQRCDCPDWDSIGGPDEVGSASFAVNGSACLRFSVEAKSFDEADQVARSLIDEVRFAMSKVPCELGSYTIRRNGIECEGFSELAGLSESADMLGLSRQRIHQLIASDSFPKPFVRLRATPVWLTSTIRAYAIRRRIG